MRVLHLTTEFPPIIYGGLGTAVGGLVMASAQAGLDVGVLLVGGDTNTSYGGLNRSRGCVGQEGTTLGLFAVPFSDFMAAARVVAAWRPDVLHLHSYWVWSTAEGLRRAFEIPLVYTVHSLDRAEYELGQGPPQCLGQWTDQEAVIRGADRVIALTQSERRLLEEYIPEIGPRVRVVGNGINDVSRLPRMNHTSCPIVLFSGRFVERKGIRELIEAIGLVLADMRGIRFVLAGGHRDCTASQMEAWLLPPSLRQYQSQICFTGWQTPEQMDLWYRTADILVVPSWYEPFGMVVLEGMVHGLAVAASAVGGPSEILEHERTGILFPPRDARALATSIIRLASAPSDRHRLATAAIEEAQQKWLWPRIVAEMEGMYAELLGCAHDQLGGCRCSTTGPTRWHVADPLRDIPAWN